VHEALFRFILKARLPETHSNVVMPASQSARTSAAAVWISYLCCPGAVSLPNPGLTPDGGSRSRACGFPCPFDMAVQTPCPGPLGLTHALAAPPSDSRPANPTPRVSPGGPMGSADAAVDMTIAKHAVMNIDLFI
jgi:hypothetical protein